jgi:endothelin-converting enzyme
MDINFFRNLSEIIKSTPRETLHDYFEWRTLVTWTPRLHKNFTAPLRRFKNVLAGKDPEAGSERWRLCVGDTDANLGHTLSSFFLQRAFTPKDKQIGDQVIQDIKKVFGANLENLDWMSSETKKTALQKGIYPAMLVRNANVIKSRI